MARLNADIDDLDYIKLKKKIGKGNLSNFFRDFVKAYVDEGNGIEKEKMLEDIDKQIKQHFQSIQDLELRKSAILHDLKLEREQKQSVQFKKSKMEFDTIKSHLGDML